MASLWLKVVSIALFTCGRSQYVETIAGAGEAGYADGRGSSARLDAPSGMAMDSSKNLYIAEFFNHRIRKIAPDGTVSSVAGFGSWGFVDGSASNARFNCPRSVALDSADNLYIADIHNNRIRKITSSGVVSTLAGSSNPGFLDGPGASARLSQPHGIASDPLGSFVFTDSSNHRIRKVTTSGVVTSIAGSTAGFLNGDFATALFNRPHGLAVDLTGNIYVADTDNHMVRKITLDGYGYVSTLAGSGAQGYVDGPGESAIFDGPCGISTVPSGIIYVVSYGNHGVRQISPSGEVSTVIGSTEPGFADGSTAVARFRLFRGIHADSVGNLFVSDDNRVRKVTLAENLPAIAVPKRQYNASFSDLKLEITGGNVTTIKNDIFGNVLIGFYTAASIAYLKNTTGILLEIVRMNSGNTGSVLVKMSPRNMPIWALQFDGAGNELLQEVVCEETESVYAVGLYTNSMSIVDYTRNKTLAEISQVNSTQNGFIAKFTSNGTLDWLIQVKGNPLSLSAKSINDSVVVGIKHSKRPGDVSSCTITPIRGQEQRFNSIDNGMTVLRLSANGSMLWARTINFAPWDEENSVFVNRIGEVSLVGWCSMLCSIYRNTESSPFQMFDTQSGHNSVSVVLSSTGNVRVWSPLNKYMKIDAQRQFRCRFVNSNPNITITSYGNPVSFDVERNTIIDLISSPSTGTAFLTLAGKERYRLNISEYDEYLLHLRSSAILQSCDSLNVRFGLLNMRGEARNGTLAFDMAQQYGYVTSLPLGFSDDALVRFRPIGDFEFRCGFENTSHAFFVYYSLRKFETSLVRIESTDGSFWGSEQRKDQIQLFNNVAFSAIAFTLVNGKITLFVNGRNLFEIDLLNVSSFLFTTMADPGSFDRVAITRLPNQLGPWLEMREGQIVSSSLFSSPTETSFTGVSSTSEIMEMVGEPSSTISSKVDSNNLSLFGFSGAMFYIIIGAMSFGVLMIAACTMVMVILHRRRRLNKNVTHYAMTYTDNAMIMTDATNLSAVQRAQLQTLVNTMNANVTFQKGDQFK